jgi:hypothetical protein
MLRPFTVTIVRYRRELRGRAQPGRVVGRLRLDQFSEVVEGVDGLFFLGATEIVSARVMSGGGGWRT